MATRSISPARSPSTAGGQERRRTDAEILATIDRLLAEAGSDKTQILSTTIYLADIKTFAEMNAVWDAWVAQGPRPRAPRSRPSSPRRNITVEIACIAAKVVKACCMATSPVGERERDRPTSKARDARRGGRSARRRYDDAVARRCAAALEKFLLDGVAADAPRSARASAIRALRVTYRSEGAPPASAARLRQILRARASIRRR